MLRLFTCTVFFLLLALPVMALDVKEAVITTDISERQPVDEVQNYPAASGKLYCFSLLEGAVEDTVISHVWYYEETEMARVILPVRSDIWRTWSSKSFQAEWSGNWRVDVLDVDGRLLTSVGFTLF